MISLNHSFFFTFWKWFLSLFTFEYFALFHFHSSSGVKVHNPKVEIIKQEAILTTSINTHVEIANLSLIPRSRLYQIKFSGTNVTHQHTITICNTKLSHTTLLLQNLHITIRNTWFVKSCVQVKNTKSDQDVGQTLHLSMINTAVTNTQIPDPAWSSACISCSDCEVRLDQVQFINNTKEQNYGLMMFDRSNISISKSLFSNNEGGVLYASHHSTVDILSSTFSQNTAKSKGGVMCLNTDVKVSIQTSEFVENTAAENGGVVYGEDNIFLVVSRSSFSQNKELSSDRYIGGGVAYLQNNVTVIMDSCSFTENSATQGGVVCAWEGVTVRTDSCNFTGNSASIGGVVHAEQGVTVTTDSCSFTGNRAQGGGVVHIENSATLRIDSCNFTGNSAGWGGVVHTREGVTMRLDSCSFTDNRAGHGGGGVVFAVGGVTVRLDSCSFTGNSAEHEGGVVYAGWSATLRIDSCSFTDNSADVDGGVVFTEKGVAVTIVSCSFTRSSADQWGGVVHAWPDATVRIDSCSFTANSANYGGVTFAFGSATVRINLCTFTGNSADVGGVVSARKDVAVEIGACIFHDNWAQAGGYGIISVQFSVINITDTLFENNSQSVVISQEQHSIDNQPTFSRLINCSFLNNIQLDSEFPADLFFSASVILIHVSVIKTSSLQKTTSILTTADAVIKSLVVSIKGEIQNVATLNKLKWDPSETNPSVISFTCPNFLQPRIFTVAKTQDGVSVVRLVCESCSMGYYYGNASSELSISKPRQNGMTCKDMLKTTPPYNVIFSMCKSFVDGKCLPCPHGANCTRGITTLPNYWGVQSQSGQVSVARCPSRYCCKESPCSYFSTCLGDRGGTLCGRCKSGFSEAMFSEQCVPDKTCGRTWLQFVSLLWTIILSVVIFFANDLKEFGKTLAEKGTWHVKMVCYRMSCGKCEAPKQMEVEEEKDPFEKDFNTFLLKQNNPKVKGPFKTVSAAAKKKGFDTKFVQIIFFYIQDASLLQVDLYRKESEEGQSFWTQLAFNISELAIELMNFSKSVCFMRNTTPILKVLMKSALGPSILVLLLLAYSVFYLVTQFISCPKLKNHVYKNLSSAAIFVLLFFFQKLATASLSLVHCVEVGDKSVLFIDGTVECYQAWQFTVFAFLFGWVIPFILILTKGPVLLSERKIDVSEFFLACFLPVLFLVLWTWKEQKQKWKKRQRNISTWHVEMIESVQKSFKDISIIGLGSISWIGVIKARRLVLVFVYTFVSNLVIRLATMILFTAAFLGLHLYINPYEDKRANQLFSVSMCAILLLGQINSLKAAFVESLVQITNVKIFLKMCELLTDIILLWAPIFVVVIGAFLALVMKIWRCLRLKPEKPDNMEMQMCMRTSNSF